MKQEDRRVQRTRELLQQALLELIRETGYDAITIQDITERANVGRATFYLHYESKDALFITCHLREMDYPYYGVLTREELLGETTPQSLVEIFRYVRDNHMLRMVFSGSKDAQLIAKRIRQQQAHNNEVSLSKAFPAANPTIELYVLASYLADAQFSLMAWWVENHTLQSPEEIARICHRLQRAAIYEAFGLSFNKTGIE